MITRVTKHPSRMRTLGPRDLDPRTLRVVRRMLDELNTRLRNEARVHTRDFASGMIAAVRAIDEVVHGVETWERAMRARLRRRQR